MFLIFSVLLLMRGHDFPGGGFTGGLVAGIGLVLYGLAYGPRAIRQVLRVNLKGLMGMGLGFAILSTLVGPLCGKPFFAAVWVTVGETKLGTPMLFDIGVYCVVLGVVLTIVTARQSMEVNP